MKLMKTFFLEIMVFVVSNALTPPSLLLTIPTELPMQNGYLANVVSDDVWYVPYKDY